MGNANSGYFNIKKKHLTFEMDTNQPFTPFPPTLSLTSRNLQICFPL